MDETLFKSILAMDSYNRGYNAAIEMDEYDNDLNIISVQIGDATIATATNDDFDLVYFDSTYVTEEADKAIGFYALSYNYNGEEIISYRGTDNLSQDSVTGYGVFLGAPNGPQAEMAFAFYNEVALAQNNNTPIDPRNANISLTGHSLGGGLAGLVGAVANDNDRMLKVAA